MQPKRTATPRCSSGLRRCALWFLEPATPPSEPRGPQQPQGIVAFTAVEPLKRACFVPEGAERTEGAALARWYRARSKIEGAGD